MYTKQMGQLALRYLLLRVKKDLSYHERTEGAAFFERTYGTLYAEHLTNSPLLCTFAKAKLAGYCKELAVHAYGTKSEKEALPEPSECFLWMSFVYVVGISLHRPFDIGSGFPKLLSLHAELEASPAMMRDFLEEVACHIVELRFKEPREEIKLVS